MKGNCEKCPLPDIVNRINTARNAVDVANANIRSSESPTEAERYKQIALEEVQKLKIAHGEFQEFARLWSGFCTGCEHNI